MTAITALPIPWVLLDRALRARRPLCVSYHGLRRVICPHALGWKHGRPIVLGYQTGGQTSTGPLDPDPRKRWRCMYVDEIAQVLAADPANSWDTPDNYNYTHPFPMADQIALCITRP